MAQVFKLNDKNKVQVNDLIRIIPMDKFIEEDIHYSNETLQEQVADTYLRVLSIDNSDPDVFIYHCEDLDHNEISVSITDSDINYVVHGNVRIITGADQLGLPVPFPYEFDLCYDIKDMSTFLNYIYGTPKLSVLLDLQNFFLMLDTIVLELEGRVKVNREYIIQEYNNCIKHNGDKNKGKVAFYFLMGKAKQDGEKYYNIVEDSSKVKNGLCLITYYDRKHTAEKSIYLVDIDTLQVIE